MSNRSVILTAVVGCLVAAGGMAPASAAARTPAQTSWAVVQASGKIIWTLKSVPLGYQGFRSASGEITESWHYVGHGSEVSFPFTGMRPLAPPGSPAMSFPIRSIRGTLSGHANGALTDGTTGGCSSNLSSLPNNPGRSATLNMATIDKHHLALWITAEDPTDLLITEPCATQLGNLGGFPNAQPDQKRKPDVHETPISTLRIDASAPGNLGKQAKLNLKAEFNLVATTTDGRRHVVGTETTTATVRLKLIS